MHMAKKRGGKKKRIVPFGAIVLAAGYATWAITQPLLDIKAQVSYSPPSKPATAVALEWPEYGEAAIGAPGYGVLASHGPQKALPTASLAKVMTALAVLRQRPLAVGEQGPDIIITQADVDSYHNFVAGDGSVVGVALGEHISEYQALQAMLLPSSNNMAVTLARWAFGSVEAYTKYANSFAKQQGLDSIHITDPSGYDPATVASARDLTLLGSLAMLNPVFAEIVAQPDAKIPVQGTVNNYNFMLGKDGNIGIKTGNNDGNNGAFLFASKQQVAGQEMILVGTIMGGPDLTTALKDSGPLTLSTLKGFSATTFVKTGQKVGSYQVPGQASVDAVAAADLIFPTWNGVDFHSSTTLRPLKGPTVAGTPVGTVRVQNMTTNATSSVPVILASPAHQPTLLWRLSHPLGH